MAEQQANIDKLNNEIKEKQAALKKQKEEIDTQILKIKEQNKNLKLVQGQVSKKERLLAAKIAELEKTKADIANQQALIADQNIKVEQAKENLKKLDAEIAAKQKDIDTKEKQLEIKDIEIDTQKNYLLLAGAILLIILSLSFLLIRTARARKKANEELRQKEILILETNEELQQTNNEIISQKEEIEEQRKMLALQYQSTQDSIKYAKTIQTAILPIKENLDKVLNSFVLFRPKDIVSGDFYWFTVLPAVEGKTEKIYIAAVDCTGHGVPGAFMSMIGSRLLNAIVNERKITSPEEILTELDKGVVSSLKQSQTENNDGMDICLCEIEKCTDGTFRISFSGAKRPLYFYKKNESQLYLLKGDRKSIGGAKTTLNKVVFTKQELVLEKGDTIFLTTDGYSDQNDKNRKKIGAVRMSEIFNEIATKPFGEQQKVLEDILDKHQEGTVQRDDITMIGVQF